MQLGNSKSIALSGIPQAMWPQKRPLKGEGAASSFQQPGCMAGATGGMPMPCGGCTAACSCFWCRGAESWRETCCEALAVTSQGAVGGWSALSGVLLEGCWQRTWEYAEGSAVSTNVTGVRNDTRRNTHYPTADKVLKFACQMNKSNTVGFLLSLFLTRTFIQMKPVLILAALQ